MHSGKCSAYYIMGLIHVYKYAKHFKRTHVMSYLKYIIKEGKSCPYILPCSHTHFHLEHNLAHWVSGGIYLGIYETETFVRQQLQQS